MTDSLFEIVNWTAAHDAAYASFGLPQSWWILQEVDKGPSMTPDSIGSPVTNIFLCNIFFETLTVCVLVLPARLSTFLGLLVTALVIPLSSMGSVYKANFAAILLTIIVT